MTMDPENISIKLQDDEPEQVLERLGQKEIAQVLIGAIHALTSPPPDEKTIVQPKSLQLIEFFYTQISQVGNEANVRLYGYTSTQSIVDYIAVRVYLQKYNGQYWVNVTSCPFEDNYTNSVEGAYYYPVVRGYYYRAKGVHLATSGISEQTESYSGSILIE
jgi:S-methylmethionine-dependent homocysteine/selenocysteine methylase